MNKMKLFRRIITCLAIGFPLVSFSTKNDRLPEENLSIYDYAYEGALKSYKDYKKEKGYSLIGPIDNRFLGKSKSDKAIRYAVMFDDGKSLIQYANNNKHISIEKIHIATKNNGLYLSKYIGNSKEDFLNDFPLELNKNDAEFSFGDLRYDSAENGKIFVMVIIENEIITDIIINSRNEEEQKKYIEDIFLQK